MIVNGLVHGLQVAAAQAIPLLSDSALKSCALLLTAGTVVALLHQRSAALRHYIWALATTAVLVLPILAVTLPELRTPVPWLAGQSRVGESRPTMETRHEAIEPTSPFRWTRLLNTQREA